MSILNADKWLYSVLTSDAALQALVSDRIYEDAAPALIYDPYVVFQFVNGINVSNFSVDKIMDDEVWIVKAAAKGNDYTVLEPIDKRIGELLHKASGTGVLGCAQEDPFRFSELDNGEIYKHLGHYYRIYTQ
jgi:hypothetical protein